MQTAVNCAMVPISDALSYFSPFAYVAIAAAAYLAARLRVPAGSIVIEAPDDCLPAVVEVRRATVLSAIKAAKALAERMGGEPGLPPMLRMVSESLSSLVPGVPGPSVRFHDEDVRMLVRSACPNVAVFEGSGAVCTAKEPIKEAIARFEHESMVFSGPDAVKGRAVIAMQSLGRAASVLKRRKVSAVEVAVTGFRQVRSFSMRAIPRSPRGAVLSFLLLSGSLRCVYVC